MSPEEVASWIPYVCKVGYDVWSRCRGRASDWPDLRGECLLCLVECANRYDPSRGIPFKPFLGKNVRLRAMGVFARRRRGVRVVSLRRDVEHARPPDEVPHDPPCLEDVAEMVGRLPDEHRTVLEMRLGLFGRSLTIREVAVALGIPQTTAFDREKAAVRMLRRVREGLPPRRGPSSRECASCGATFLRRTRRKVKVSYCSSACYLSRGGITGEK